MKVKNQSWTIRKYRRVKTHIDPSPPFQRGEVWKTPAKQLLIDSILCEFDVPKIYLHDMGQQPLQRYAVADGQQRLRAIWGYLRDEYALANRSYIKSAPWSGKTFSQLSKKEQLQILNTRLVTAVITSTVDEVRELFWRLQQGSQLNPAEKRNCIPSQLGDLVRMLADNHALFRAGIPAIFSPSRRKRDDMCAHAFAIEVNKATEDLKAPNILALYEEFKTNVPQTLKSKVNRALTYMSQMTTSSPGCIRRKWSFADLYRVISEHRSDLPDPAELARRFLVFERRRLEHNAEPEELVEGARVPRRNRHLYDYIIAFNTSGAEAENLETRYTVLSQDLIQ